MAYQNSPRNVKPGRRSNASTSVREYTKASGRAPLTLSEAAQDYLEALVVEAVRMGAGVYVGAPSTTGGRKIRIYGDDDAAELYLTPADDPAEEVGGFAEFALGAQFEAMVHERVSARRAERAQEGRQGAHPGRGSARTRSAPPEPSDEPTGATT